MRSFKLIAALLICLFYPFVYAADKVIAIPIPELTSSSQSKLMIKKELPKSLDYFSPRIVGGSIARRNEFPEFTQLFVDGLDGFVYSVCGATLLSANKVLTAAHCTAGIAPSRIYVLPNFYSFNDNISFNDLIRSARKNQHPDYQQTTQFINNDVSILTLSRRSNTPTAKIFAGSDQLEGDLATIIGTGVTAEGSTNPPAILRKVTIPIVSNEQCKSVYGNSRIKDSMLCAGLPRGGKDSCQGDSGGPLWVDVNGEKVQAGIVSWGVGCARPGIYGVNARTSALIDFILRHAPDTQIIEGNLNFIPILQLLLLDESSSFNFEPVNCDGGELNIDASLVVSTPAVCSDGSSGGYYKNYTFTLEQDQRIAIKALARLSAGPNTIDLYSGTGQSISLIEQATWTTAEGGSAFMIRDLSAGSYSVYIRTGLPSTGIDLSLTGFDCGIFDIELDTPTTFVFEHNCKDTEAGHRYVNYHAFSLTTAGSILVTADVASNSSISIVLYEQTENGLELVSGGITGQIVDKEIYENNLSEGDYVIKTAFVEENAAVTLEVNAENCRINDSISLGEQKIISYSTDCQTLRNQHEAVLDFSLIGLRNVIITSNKLFKIGTTTAKLQYESELLQNFEYVHTFRYFGEHTIVTTSNDTNDQIITTAERSCSSQGISIGDEVDINFLPLCRAWWTNRYQDYRTFTLDSNQNVKITALSDQTAPGISLYQGDNLDNLILLANGSGDYDVPAEIEQNLSPGTYTIRSHADYSVYDFHLSIE